MNLNMIESADKITGVAHFGQVRKNSGIPYISHPRQVSKMVIDKFSDYIKSTENEISAKIALTSMACAALLHDVVEDTEYTFDDIEYELRSYGTFGIYLSEIREHVVGLTDTAKVLYPMANRAERKAIDGARISQHSQYVHMIKMCDIICNVTDYVNEDPEYAIKFIKEKIAYVKFLKNLPEQFSVELYNFLDSMLIKCLEKQNG